MDLFSFFFVFQALNLYEVKKNLQICSKHHGTRVKCESEISKKKFVVFCFSPCVSHELKTKRETSATFFDDFSRLISVTTLSRFFFLFFSSIRPCDTFFSSHRVFLPNLRRGNPVTTTIRGRALQPHIVTPYTISTRAQQVVATRDPVTNRVPKRVLASDSDSSTTTR